MIDIQKTEVSVSAFLGQLLSINTAMQAGIVIVSVLLAWLLAGAVGRRIALIEPDSLGEGLFKRMLLNASNLAVAALAALFLSVAESVSEALIAKTWFLRLALIVAVVVLLDRAIRNAETGEFVGRVMRWIVLPMSVLYLLGLLEPLNAQLGARSVSIGSIDLTLGGVLRVLVFGGILFWAGWIFNETGQKIIRRQEKLESRTREVIAKLFQIALIAVVFLLLLQVMGIDLTALAVFGGAVGVGLGFGLQSVAANFISGLIILFDRSISLGDYIETEGGVTGHVRELNMRFTTLETYDGKDVLVPNEKFVSGSFVNWTHHNHKQRYRVDFGVGYQTDIRALCDLIREVVAKHPRVISGEGVPFEEQPDCEIDSFGDNGINMFVEFWMIGIDDGKNRVGGDLLLDILETLRANNIEIPFPQREVRILNETLPAFRKAASDSG